MNDRQDQTDGAVKERVKTEKKEPTLYKVVLLNDDYTTMEFVLRVLEEIFQKSPAEAYRIMIQVHLNGSGIAGVYPWEVAETKVDTLAAQAREIGAAGGEDPLAVVVVGERIEQVFERDVGVPARDGFAIRDGEDDFDGGRKHGSAHASSMAARRGNSAWRASVASVSTLVSATSHG